MLRKLAVVSSLCGVSGLPALAGTFTADFNSGVPANTAVYGSAVVEPDGGVGNSGALKLTKAVTSQSGGFVIEDIDSGNLIYGFDATFKARVGGGTSTPADGFSFNFGPDILDGAFGEDGSGFGIRFVFDTYDNGGGEAPAIDIMTGVDEFTTPAVVATRKLTIPEITTDAEFADVQIQLQPNGLLNLVYDGKVVYTNFAVPNYRALSGRFAFGARTGGATANHFIDDLAITTFLNSETAIAQQPVSITGVQGRDATFRVAVTNPEGVTYQWLRDGNPIAGATTETLILPDISAADEGARISVRVTGPNNTVTSDEATLSVVEIPNPVNPEISIDFDDGLIPPNATIGGMAYANTFGGVNESGMLVLTDAINDYSGYLTIADPDAGAPVYGLSARFYALVGGGTALPADGFSFNAAATIPDPVPVEIEEGLGNGLTVTFDVYDNGGGEAPAIDVKWNGSVVASAKVPLSFIQTFPNYAEVLINLESDGTIDVAYGGSVVHQNVEIPGFTFIEGAQYLFGARTGGANANHWIDSIEISTVNTPGDLRIAVDPADQTVLVGRSVTFSGEVNATDGVTFQWLRNGEVIDGATSSTYTVSATTLADAGATFQLRATRGGQTVTSEAAALTVVDLAAPATPDLSLNFNDATVPTGTAVYGSAQVLGFGGTGDSGHVQLTDAVNSLAGGFVIEPLIGGAEVSELSAAFDVRIGGGSAVPADGMSFNFASDLPSGASGEVENGVGTGLSILFDIYDNGGGEAPAIEVKYKGTIVASTRMSIAEISTGDEYRQVLLNVDTDGTLDLAYGDRVIYSNLQLTNYTFIANGRFGFYARTGGLNAVQAVDNVQIAVTKSAAPLRFVDEPGDVALLAGSSATFSATLSDPVGATYQWLRNGTEITGATGSTYTIASLSAADEGARISVRATGPGGTVTSGEAVITVIQPITISDPDVSFDFEDFAQPVGTHIAGTTYIDNSVHLTDAVTGAQGSFVIEDTQAGEPVSAFTAVFQVYASDGSANPADGFSFVWASDVDPLVAFGEAGTGTGLVVSFDPYDNGGGEAPGVDIFYKGAAIATVRVPRELLLTEGEWVDVAVRVENDGTLDVQYDGTAVYHNLQLPGYSAISGGFFGFGGRTGGEYLAQAIDNIQIATTTGDVTEPSNITITRTAPDQLTISWTGGGTLQATDSLNDPNWTPVAGAANPYTTDAEGDMRFFRVVR